MPRGSCRLAFLNVSPAVISFAQLASKSYFSLRRVVYLVRCVTENITIFLPYSIDKHIHLRWHNIMY